MASKSNTPATTKEHKNVEQQAKKTFVVVPPDGGWGWVVTAAACYTNFVVDGTIFSSGIFLPEIAKSFDINEVSASFVWSLAAGVHLLAGPICAGSIQTIGFRATAFIGSIIVTLVLASIALPLPFWVLAIVMGLVGGVGMCLVFMTSIGITVRYFTDRRIFALGIVNCGSAFGTIVFAYLASYLLSIMSWKMAYLVLSGFSAVMILAVLAYAPLERALIEETEQVKPGTLVQSRTLGQPSQPSRSDDDDGVTYWLKLHSRPSLSSAEGVTMLTERAYDDFLLNFIEFCRPKQEQSTWAKWLLCGLTHNRSNVRSTVIKIHPETKKKLAEGVDTKIYHMYGCLQVLPKAEEGQFQVFVSKVFNFKALRDPAFLTFCISCSLAAAAIMIIYTYERARNDFHGLESDQTTAYIALLGAASMFWRLILGFIAFMPGIPYKMLYVFVILITGVIVILSSYIKSTYFHILYCLIVGFGHACFAVYRPAMLAEFAGVQRMANASGVSFIFMGVFQIVGPPFAGWLLHWREKNDFPMAFGLCGTFFILSSILAVPFALLKRVYRTI